MNRSQFKKAFKCLGPAVLPVIHVTDSEQAARNIRVASREGAQGVFLINHDFDESGMPAIIRAVREVFPDLWLGVNFLGVTGKEAFPVLGDLQSDGVGVDAYWADDARVDERMDLQDEAEAIARARADSGWSGLYFGGTAFKKQRPVEADRYEQSAQIATGYMEVVTTSGPATGKEADLAKVDAFRRGCGEHALALASGVSPENIGAYAPLVDAVLVATGINFDGDFYNISAARLRRVIADARAAGLRDSGADDRQAGDRDDRWYLYRIAPNVRPGVITWNDPSTMYIDSRSFNALLDDLTEPFDGDEFDVVAGPDAMGFVLGAAIAARFGKGFLTIRKAGKMPVAVDVAEFSNYTGRSRSMELRKPAFRPGTRVLLVDQWIETGGTMRAAIDLVERQGGVVAGIATVCLQEAHGANALRERYKCSTAVLSGTKLQRQMDAAKPEFFDDFDWECYLPEIKDT